MNIVFTARKSSAVFQAIKGNFTGPDDLNLILGYEDTRFHSLTEGGYCESEQTQDTRELTFFFFFVGTSNIIRGVYGAYIAREPALRYTLLETMASSR